MKVAVCISGQPRNVQRGFTYIQPNLLERNDCDVFIHTWWDSEQVGKTFINAGDHVASNPVAADTLTTIIRLYSPTAMHFEPQIEFDTSNYVENVFPAIKPFASLSQKYSAWRVHELRRESGREYDAVIRLRFDYALQSPITAEDYNLDHIAVPNRCPHVGGIDDTFAIGRASAMDMYGSLYNSIFGLYRAGVPFCDELLLG
ncbi:hypothetical protein LCGC14_2373740, partial [marine sediment metagenome]